MDSQHTPHTTHQSYNFMVVAVIGALIIGFIGGYFVGSQSGEKKSAETAGLPAAASVETVNWKTYTSTNTKFSFRYPEQFFVAYATQVNGTPDENIPHFYANQQEVNAALSCIEKKQATLQQPCDAGLFDVADVTTADPTTKQPIDLYKDSTDPSLPKTDTYKDSQGRNWTLLGPTYVLGGTQTDAQLKTNNTTYQLQIHIWDRFVSGLDPSGVAAQQKFIHQILDTVTFSY